jgi:hypothetical protein
LKTLFFAFFTFFLLHTIVMLDLQPAGGIIAIDSFSPLPSRQQIGELKLNLSRDGLNSSYDTLCCTYNPQLRLAGVRGGGER